MKKLNFISFGDALEKALSNIDEIDRTEIVLLSEARNRVLARDVISRKNLPSFDNSAMDGFAVDFRDAGKRVEIVETVYAGDVLKPCLREGQCYRIMTGAKVPTDANAIVPFESCPETGADYVLLPDNIKPGDNLRKKGEECSEGEILVKKGERLTSAHIAILAAQGIVAVSVFEPLSIAIVSTGNEIKEPWEQAGEDEIYNANAFGIGSMLEEYGFFPSYVGSIPDSKERSIDFISSLKGYDVIITTGGISMGEADFVEEAFLANGLEVIFHGVNVKPGKPTMMGKMGDTFVMAMPGNPLTAMLNIFLLSVPVLAKMQGANRWHFAHQEVINTEEFRIKPSRSNLVLGRMVDGRFHVLRKNKVGSGMLTPLMEADCVAVFNEKCAAPKRGDFVKVILFGRFPSEDINLAFNTDIR